MRWAYNRSRQEDIGVFACLVVCLDDQCFVCTFRHVHMHRFLSWQSKTDVEVEVLRMTEEGGRAVDSLEQAAVESGFVCKALQGFLSQQVAS